VLILYNNLFVDLDWQEWWWWVS